MNKQLSSSQFGFPIGVIKIPVSLSSFTEVDTNGLPRLPISVTCYARFRRLLHIKHSNLSQYLDVIREKLEIVSVVCEYWGTSFSDISGPVTDFNWLSQRFCECLSALAFMNDGGLVHCCLTPGLIMLDSNGRVKIGGYGVYYATDWGNSVDFLLPNPLYSAPELFLFLCNHANNSCQSTHFKKSDKFWIRIEADVWSLGVIFFEIIHGREIANPLLKFRDENNVRSGIIAVLLKGLCQANEFPTLPEFLRISTSSFSPELDTFTHLVRRCLRFDALTRPGPRCLMNEINKLLRTNCHISTKSCFEKIYDHPRKYEFHPHLLSFDDSKNNILKAHNFIHKINDLSELYYYWKLAGGKIQVSLKDQLHLSSIRDNYYNSSKRELTKEKGLLNDTNFDCLLPPILRIPHYLAIVQQNTTRAMCSKEQWPPSEVPQPRTFQFKIIPLPSEHFIKRISNTPLHNLYPLLICQDLQISSIENMNVCSAIYSVNNNNNNNNSCSSNNSISNQFMPTMHNSSLLAINKKHTHFLDLLFTNNLMCNIGIDWNMISFTSNHNESTINTMLQQPLSVRETDVDYQIYRTRLFTRILNGLPATKQYLRLEARKDIPPFLRWKVWAALLNVYPNRDFESSYLKTLHKINKLGLEIPPTNEPNNYEQDSDSNSKSNDFSCNLLDGKVINQISVDLPRCHAYDPLLASSIGQSVLRRVLLATLLMKPGTLDYTQGMDSVAAVFVRICYPDEALAAACLSAFLSTKLPGFFSSGGLTVGLKSYFSTLIRLLAFHLPRLAVRLVEMNVPLIGLTTGWIYTLFAHTMPLDRIELLWDTIIPGPASLSMFFYIAFFIQLDKQVNFESLGLEKICTILSNFPDVNLDKCRTDALKLAVVTPRSLTAWSIPNRQKSTKTDDGLVEVEDLNSKKNELCHLPSSIHCELAQMTTLDCSLSGIEDNDAMPIITDSYNTFTLENWEMIDYPSGNRNRPQIIPKFLAFLMNQNLWHKATQARQLPNVRSNQGANNESNNIITSSSPGLLIIFGNDERLCWRLALWLIKCDIDRVCILCNGSTGMSDFLSSCC
ncbi:TBC domain-containing protein kinase-like protein [Schistosoma japonicum]|nr:TBC domain-containing protein kinase-like protein [Schistosoma japonicum]